MDPLQSSQNAQLIADTLLDEGWEPHQVAGILGHLYHESRFKADGPRGDSGTAHGVAQWRGDRFENLQAFAAQNGTDWTDLKTQALFIDHEMNTTEKYAGDAMRAATNVHEATVSFMHFERPQGYTRENPQGGMKFNDRLAIANAIEQSVIAMDGGLKSGPNDIAIAEAQADLYEAFKAGDAKALFALADDQSNALEVFTAQASLISALDSGDLVLSDDVAEQFNQNRPEFNRKFNAERGLVSAEEKARVEALPEDERKAWFDANKTIEFADSWYNLNDVKAGEATQELTAVLDNAFDGLSEQAQTELAEKQRTEATAKREAYEAQVREQASNAAERLGLGGDMDMFALMFLALLSGANPEAFNALVESMMGGGGSGVGAGYTTSQHGGQMIEVPENLPTLPDLGPSADGQFGFLGNGSFTGVDERLATIIQETAKDFPLRVRVMSGKVGRNSGDHAAGKAVDITLYDQDGNALGNYQNTENFRAYELFAQAAYLKARELYPELTDGVGNDFNWGGLFGDNGNGGYKYGSNDKMDFRIADNSRFRAGTIMGGLNQRHSFYDNGDILGGSQSFSLDAFTEGMNQLRELRLTPEQAAHNRATMFGVAKASGSLPAVSSMVASYPGFADEENQTTVAVNSLPTDMQAILLNAGWDSDKDGQIEVSEVQGQLTASAAQQAPEAVEAVKEALGNAGVVTGVEEDVTADEIVSGLQVVASNTQQHASVKG